MVVPLPPPGAPDNTLLATLKVLDIGLGRVLFDEAVTEAHEGLELTTEGMMLGTPEYMAPEQARDPHKADIRADLYSLGCVAYHLLAGRPPFTDPDVLSQIIKHETQTPDPIREHEPSVPEAVQTVLDRMLAKKPAQRFATPAEAARAVEPFFQAPTAPLARTILPKQSYQAWVDAQPHEEIRAAPVSVRWFYRRKDEIKGPLATAQMNQLAAAGWLHPDDEIWMEGDDPSLAVVARAVIDFSAFARPVVQPTTPAARVVAPPTAPMRPPTPAETGFDPETGQVLDAAKYKQWQRDSKIFKNPPLSPAQTAAPSIQEVYRKARVTIDHWVDLDRNRKLILTGDMAAIRADPDIQRFLTAHAKFGQDMLYKLWQHLEFMVENRRKYYSLFV
jgi:hypothetical protein